MDYYVQRFSVCDVTLNMQGKQFRFTSVCNLSENRCECALWREKMKTIWKKGSEKTEIKRIR